MVLWEGVHLVIKQPTGVGVERSKGMGTLVLLLWPLQRPEPLNHQLLWLRPGLLLLPRSCLRPVLLRWPKQEHLQLHWRYPVTQNVAQLLEIK